MHPKGLATFWQAWSPRWTVVTLTKTLNIGRKLIWIVQFEVSLGDPGEKMALR